ncbi:MAG: cupredoxin domain-containing protein [Chloroflexi bacterium]|nr:cupredoxin domain-containing protein [Chloroflexota bacterium]
MRRIALAAVALLGILVAACGGGAAATTAAGGTIKLTLTEFKYSSPTIELKADEKATLELKNAGTVEHDFKIAVAGVEVLIQPGKSATRTIGPLKPGTYEFFCSVPGHKDAGMKGQLVVK